MKYLHLMETLIESEKQKYIVSLRESNFNKENEVPNALQHNQSSEDTPKKVSFNESVRVRLFKKEDPASPSNNIGKLNSKCSSPPALKKPILALREKNINIPTPNSPLSKMPSFSSPISKLQSPKEDDFPSKHQVNIYSSPNQETSSQSTLSPKSQNKFKNVLQGPSSLSSKSPLSIIVGNSSPSSPPTSPINSPIMFTTLLKRIHDMDNKVYNFNSLTDKTTSEGSQTPNLIDLGRGQIQLFTAFSTSTFKCGLVTLAPQSIKPRCKSRMSEIFFIFNASSLRFIINSPQSFEGSQTIENPPPSSIVIIPNNSTYYIENYGSKSALIGFALLK